MKERPQGVFIHTAMFVYQLQIMADGTINKYKVRMVIRGFTFIKDVDFKETFAPVSLVASIKLFYVCILQRGRTTQTGMVRFRHG